MAGKTLPTENQLFYPFDTSPPDGGRCIDNVYEAFAGYRFEGGWCLQCFTKELEQNAQRQRVREAPANSFDMIYFEHPSCSGGIDTFLHFLPRGLEISFFDSRHYMGFPDQMLKLGVFQWREEEQAALRHLFCRVAISWFSEGTTEPLQGPTHQTSSWVMRGDAPLHILQALFFLRMEPGEVFRWLLKIDTKAAWYGITQLLKDPSPVESPVYFELAEDRSEADYNKACEALNRLCLDSLYASLTSERIFEKWLEVSDQDPRLGQELSDVESYYDPAAFVLSKEQREEDERLLRKVL
ncbi:hypothetical protein [uncultured Roseibium sp.]|uniref:hypothetical protein n=1 Tax=uncultured Roseibium sp. TaxID=1936171 RepID=UPI002638CD07|nr:hypothetical protein [uncultured Roseibium sp.]